MRDSLERHREAAFSAYGRVMAKIGAFEQFMRVILAKREIAEAAVTRKKLDTEAFSRRLMRMEFGGLAQEVCTKFKLDDVVRAAVKQAKEFRNYLAHDFWAGHFQSLRTERGLEGLLRHCAIYDEQFERVATVVIRATGVDVADYVSFIEGTPAEPDAFKEWEALLGRAEAKMRETGELYRGV